MHRITCKNCGLTFNGNYCPQCGQSAGEGRIDASYFLHDIPHSIFHVDKGFFYTLRRMFTNPGGMMKDYISGKRVEFFRPFAYVLLMSTLATILLKGIDWVTREMILKNNPTQSIPHHDGFFNQYFSVFIFLMIPLASLVTWVTFIKREYNYWEHFLINTYIAAQLNLLLVMVHLANFFLVWLRKSSSEDDPRWLLIFFMMLFLYLYGHTFGHIMSRKGEIFRLSITLSLMNTVLATLYFTGFNLTGIF